MKRRAVDQAPGLPARSLARTRQGQFDDERVEIANCDAVTVLSTASDEKSLAPLICGLSPSSSEHQNSQHRMMTATFERLRHARGPAFVRDCACSPYHAGPTQLEKTSSIVDHSDQRRAPSDPQGKNWI